MALVALAAFTLQACCSGPTPEEKAKQAAAKAAELAAKKAAMAKELATKGPAGVAQGELKGKLCKGERLKTPYINHKDTIKPVMAPKVFYSTWFDPALDAEKKLNGKLREVTGDDLDWYGTLEVFCSSKAKCQGTSCVLLDESMYLKEQVEFRIVDGAPQIVAAFKGMSIDGANKADLEAAHKVWAAEVAKRLAGGAAKPAAPKPAEAPKPATP